MTRNQRLEDLWKRFLKKGLGGLTDYELLEMMDEVEHREGAFQELLKRVTSDYNLRYVMRFFESHKERAWQELVRLNPTSYDLGYVISFTESLRRRASELLRKIEILKAKEGSKSNFLNFLKEKRTIH